MASTEVQQALPTNGANDQAYSHSSDVGHEDTTGPSPVEPTPEQNIPATGLEEAGAEQLRSGLAQPEETAVSPVSDKPLVVQSAASSKQKPTTSPTKRPTPTVQTTTTKGASGPPTPQVKKVSTHLLDIWRGCRFGCLFLTRTLCVADSELGQVRRGRHEGCSPSNFQGH